MAELPDLSRLSLACDTAPPTGPKQGRLKDLLSRAGPYARSSNPHKKRDMWGYGLDDSRGDRAMDVELRREQRQNQDDFLERMEQSGDFTPAEMALLRRNANRDMTTPEEDLIRMQQKRERIEQNMEAKKTQIATLQAAMTKMMQRLPSGLLTEEDDKEITKLDRALERRQSELRKLQEDFEEVKAETREKQEYVYRG